MFQVTYEIITQESAEHGDCDEQGYIAESVSLREAIDLVNSTRTSHVDCQSGVEASSSIPEMANWFTVYNGMEYLTGAHENRSLHFPDSITGASRKRIFDLLGVYY